ncbi:MAG TPA: hypothetical protein VF411_13240 [Bacteroidia bacterium]
MDCATGIAKHTLAAFVAGNVPALKNLWKTFAQDEQVNEIFSKFVCAYKLDTRTMKKFLLLLLLVCIGRVNAQPVIDSTNFAPKTWEMFERQKYKFASINTQSTGANYTWNYMSAPFVITDTLMFDSIDANNCQYNNPLFFSYPT